MLAAGGSRPSDGRTTSTLAADPAGTSAWPLQQRARSPLPWDPVWNYRSMRGQVTDTGPGAGATAWRVVRYRWRVLLLVLLPWTALVLVYVLSRPPQYSAVSVVSIVPDSAESAGSDFISLTASRYAVAMTSTRQLEGISRETGVSSEELQRSVTVDSTAPSANIKITATLDDPETAKAVADATADSAVASERGSEQLTTTKVSSAVLQKGSLLTSRTVILAALLVAGAALALWVATLVDRARPLVRRHEDLERAAGLPSLATVDGRGSAGHGAGAKAAQRQAQAQALQLALEQHVTRPLRQVTVIGVGAVRGTATTAYLLARALASGRRVLLVDADAGAATLTRMAGDGPRSSVAEALESGRAPDPPDGRAGLHLLTQTDGDGPHARRDASADQWADLLDDVSGRWDVVVLAAPMFDADGEFRQPPIPSSNALLVVPREASASAVRIAARRVRLIHDGRPGAVLFRGPSDR